MNSNFESKKHPFIDGLNSLEISKLQCHYMRTYKRKDQMTFSFNKPHLTFVFRYDFRKLKEKAGKSSYKFKLNSTTEYNMYYNILLSPPAVYACRCIMALKHYTQFKERKIGLTI